MKASRLIKVTICALIASTSIEAQTIYDAAKFTTNDLNGTARFVGMGGAMGALGTDISTIGVNPAGIGLFRSNDLMTTFGFNYNDSKSNYDGSIMKSNKFSGSYDNIGFVYSNKIGNTSAIKYVNFGFNYRKVKDFNRNFSMNGNFGPYISQTNQMAELSNKRGNPGFYSEYINPQDFMANDAFYITDVPWLSALAYRAHIIRPYDRLDQNNNRIPQMDNGRPVLDKNGNPCYLKEYRGFLGNNDIPNVNGNYYSSENGGIRSFDLNSSININNRFYIGATMGLYNIDYNRTSVYRETSLTNGDNYTLSNWSNTQGAGVDFKLGLIIRPIESSPLRFGAAIHSPIFYKLTKTTSSELVYNTFNYETNRPVTGIATPVNNYNDRLDAVTDYQLQTPWLYNLSMGYTIGNSVALGVEYEYKDYSSSRLNDNEGYRMLDENNDMKNMLKAVNTIRVGAEVKLVPEFALRAGYNYSSAAYNNNAFLILPEGSVNTSTEFANDKSRNNYTLGLGYKLSNFYADIAYQYSTYSQDFYAFDALELKPTKVDNSRQQVIMTVGFRF